MSLLVHLLARIRDAADEEMVNFTPEHLLSMDIWKGKIFSHPLIKLRYKTYDFRMDYDIIRPRYNADVMVVSGDDDPRQLEHSPFWIARVIGTFHVLVSAPKRPEGRRIDFLWVRWLGRHPDQVYRDGECALEKVGFVPEDESTPPFGFIDPATVVRTIHLIPNFSSGHTSSLLGPSPLARISKNEPGRNEDWRHFYVNRSLSS